MITALTANGFTSDETNTIFSRTFSRTVNVVFHGLMESRLVCRVNLHSSGMVEASFIKNGSVLKVKRYSFGKTRAWNAIKATIENAGFQL